MLGVKTKDTVVSEYLEDEEILLIASKIVNRYASKGSIPLREKEDVVMSIVEKFIRKKELILDNFQGKAKLSTYCVSVLNNMCCEIIRRDLKHWNIQEDKQQTNEELSSLNSVNRLVIKDEIKYLHKIILLFGDEMPKVRLFTAFRLLLEILENDVKQYDIEYINNNLLKILNTDNNVSNGDIYNRLSKVVNIVENKNIKADAVRMWLNKTKSTIIERLNMGHGNSNYNEETYHILFEYYYENHKKDSKSKILTNISDEN